MVEAKKQPDFYQAQINENMSLAIEELIGSVKAPPHLGKKVQCNSTNVDGLTQ